MSALDKIMEMCPICDSGEFQPHHDGTYSFRHGRKTYVVTGQQYAVCSECGTSGYLPGQRKENARLIKEFQASLVDYISPSDILSVREKYNLTQKQASQLFKGGVNGFSKWERGVAFPSAATAMLLKIALASSEAVQILAHAAKVDFQVEIPRNELDQGDISTKGLPLVITQCTHAEYRDDFVDNDIESDIDTKWNALAQSSTSTSTKLRFQN
jgi:HTH-type transcriptional regulator/antitoxin MqsA